MTTIKDRLKMFENASPPPLMPKPKLELLSSTKKPPRLIAAGVSVDNESGNVNNNHVDDQSSNQLSFVIEAETPHKPSEPEIPEILEIPEDRSPKQQEHQQQSDDSLLDNDIDEFSDSDSVDELTFELDGSIYNLPGLENFICDELPEDIEQIDERRFDEPDNDDSKCEEEYIHHVDTVEEIATSEDVVNEVKVNLSRIGSKRLIEEIFNTSVWRNSQNFSDDFIFNPHKGSIDSTDGSDAVVACTVDTVIPDISADRDSARLSIVSTADDRRKSTQSLTTKSPRKSLFSNIFRSKRGPKKSSSDKSRPSDVSDIDDSFRHDSPNKKTHAVDKHNDGDNESIDKHPKKPLNSIFNRDWLNSLGEGIKKKANVMAELRKVFAGKGKKKSQKEETSVSVANRYDEKTVLDFENDIYDDGGEDLLMVDDVEEINLKCTQDKKPNNIKLPKKDESSIMKNCKDKSKSKDSNVTRHVLPSDSESIYDDDDDCDNDNTNNDSPVVVSDQESVYDDSDCDNDGKLPTFPESHSDTDNKAMGPAKGSDNESLYDDGECGDDGEHPNPNESHNGTNDKTSTDDSGSVYDNEEENAEVISNSHKNVPNSNGVTTRNPESNGPRSKTNEVDTTTMNAELVNCDSIYDSGGEDEDEVKMGGMKIKDEKTDRKWKFSNKSQEKKSSEYVSIPPKVSNKGDKSNTTKKSHFTQLFKTKSKDHSKDKAVNKSGLKQVPIKIQKSKNKLFHKNRQSTKYEEYDSDNEIIEGSQNDVEIREPFSGNVKKRFIEENSIYDQDDVDIENNVAEEHGKTISEEKKKEKNKNKDKNTKKAKEIKVNIKKEQIIDESKHKNDQDTKIIKKDEGAKKTKLIKKTPSLDKPDENHKKIKKVKNVVKDKIVEKASKSKTFSPPEEYDEDNIEEYISDVENPTTQLETDSQQKDLSKSTDTSRQHNQETDGHVSNFSKLSIKINAELKTRQLTVDSNLKTGPAKNQMIKLPKPKKIIIDTYTYDVDDSPAEQVNESVEEKSPTTTKNPYFETDDPVVRKLMKKNLARAIKTFKLKEPVIPIAVAKALKTIFTSHKDHLQMNIGELVEVIEYRQEMALIKNSLGKCGWTLPANLEIIRAAE